MASRVQLMGGDFQFATGERIAFGYLIFKINQDTFVGTDAQLSSEIEFRIDLDGDGNVVESPAQSVWGNDQTDVVTYYKVSGHDARGLRVWGPNNQQVIGDGGRFSLTLGNRRLISLDAVGENMSEKKRTRRRVRMSCKSKKH